MPPATGSGYPAGSSPTHDTDISTVADESSGAAVLHVDGDGGELPGQIVSRKRTSATIAGNDHDASKKAAGSAKNANSWFPLARSVLTKKLERSPGLDTW
ncbi:hypothetical protein EJB05_10774 [Eragrostis curvula]|uniref:Uncharacterized protein n=1 Tax=Eragrostis curvula TaxID=38414 RepID=A0A5J9VNV7_9POAL|nr:hypothetical protein EJB05_10774 [Eragrostis curvula]